MAKRRKKPSKNVRRQRQRKAQEIAKRFERSTLAYYTRGEFAWGMRIPDAMYSRRGSAKTPADLIATSPSGNYLVECKTTKGARLPFDRVRPHQLENLEAFEGSGLANHGVLAVCMGYGGGGMTSGRCFHIPVGAFLYWSGSLGRKSLPLELPALAEFELVYRRGTGWVMPRVGGAW